MDILIIEPDTVFGEQIKTVLEKNNMRVFLAFDGISGLSIAFSRHLDFIVMERFITDIDGITLCKELLKRHDIPLLILSDISDRNDKILCIGTGAEEYIEKPIRPIDILYHLNMLIKRNEVYNQSKHDSILKYKDIIHLNCRIKQVLIYNKDIDFTDKEYDILELLLSHKGVCFSKEEIYQNVWKKPEYYDTGYVTTYINRLRSKFSKYNFNPIKTIRLKGYMIEE